MWQLAHLPLPLKTCLPRAAAAALTWSLFSSAGLEPDAAAEASELLDTPQRAIGEVLTPHQRRVLVALALNGVPIDVLAERLNTTRGALFKTLHDATERLVAAALERLGERPARVVDVGTGSGALAIAIAAAAPQAEVWATDTSRCAVALARANVRRHRLHDRIIVRHGDLLEPVPGPIELIVANLPYLPASAAASHPELAAEPGEAVFTVGDGLGPYRRLIDAGAERLTADGALVIQLHRRVLVANRNELTALRAALASQAPTSVYKPRAPLVAGAAA